MGEKIESETQSLKRLQYLDLAKAVGMLCVLIGHSFISEKINTVIYAFHMPLFFFISGYLCKPQKVALHIPQELRIRSRGTERHSASN